ncbi:MAG: hypothetical protein KDD84_23270, partial [Caldilineaceae bacterium]|nr:hypothetical protein [Caldilineaceae bacterium]
MQPNEQPFTYTADRSVYTSAALAFGFLILIESSLVAILILVLAPTMWLKLVLLLGLVGLNVWAIRNLRSPLATAHALTPQTLHLRYGDSLNLELPRSSLAAAQPVQESVGGLGTFSARYDADRDRVVAVFSPKGQILLTLTEPHTVRLNWQRAETRQILINVDQSDVLLAALNLPQSVAAPATSQQDRADLPLLHKHSPSSVPSPVPLDGEDALILDDVSRHFGEQVAIDSLNLGIRRGEIYGFLG